MKVTADATIDTASAAAGGTAFDIIALPGGMPGAEHLRDSATLTRLLHEQHAAGRWIAAVCASPAIVLASHGLLSPDTACTSHANFVDKLPSQASVDQRVVVDAAKKIITSRGPGTSLEFALQCVACVAGKEPAEAVAKPMHMHAIELK
jgi:4-methyl-5(b-hydroxyethyl)-thiazole monophosphate biosynthesis